MCLSFCLSTGRVHISHNALQHYPEFHGADTWGVPGQVQLGGVPISHNAFQDYPEFHGADTWGVPGQVQLGVPISHNALQHYPEFHGADTWGYPARSSYGGYPYPIMLSKIIQNSMGQTPGGYPVRSSQGGTLPGQDGGGTLPGQDGGVPCWRYRRGRVPPGRVPPWQGTPLGQVRMGGGGVIQLGQQKEYSLHGGRYASCVHAGGLSCIIYLQIVCKN